MTKIHLELSLAYNYLFKNSASAIRERARSLIILLASTNLIFPIYKAGMIMSHLLELPWGINEILKV